MAFPVTSVMPHRNPPMNTTKYKQTTLEQYMRWHKTQDISNRKPTQASIKPNHKNKEYNTSTTNEYRHPPIKAVTFNTRGMHNTILDLQTIMNTQKKPTIIHLTETNHSHIKSIWREVLKDYKLIHTFPTLDPTTNRRSGGTILAARRDTYKEVTAVPTPPHI
jgi:hypothetical protein